MSFKDKERAKEYLKSWKLANPNYKKDWLAKNPDMLLKEKHYQKIWREENKEYMSNYKMEWIKNNKDKTKNSYQRAKLNNPLRFIFTQSKYRAKQKNIEFSIKKEDIVYNDVCPVFGTPIAVSKDLYSANSPSLDRIDNTKGYMPGNVKVISYRANVIKNSGNAEEHRKIANYIDWESGKYVIFN